MERRRLGSLLGVLIGALGVAFVVAQIVREREAFAEALRSADLSWLVVAVLAGLAAMTGIGLNWTAILHDHGATAPWRAGLSWFFVGQLGKYVPGGIWPIVGQAELANRSGVARSVAYPSTVWSMLAQLLGAATVAAGAGFASDGDRTVIAGFLAAGVVVVLAATSSTHLRTLATRTARRFVPDRTLLLPDGGWLTAQVARHVPVWLLYSAMNVAVVVALGTDLTWASAADVAFATCVSWIGGFVIIGLPGGIGVREALFVSLMTAPLGAGPAASVAVTSRLVTIVVDLLGAAVASLAGPRRTATASATRPTGVGPGPHDA